MPLWTFLLAMALLFIFGPLSAADASVAAVAEQQLEADGDPPFARFGHNEGCPCLPLDRVADLRSPFPLTQVNGQDCQVPSSREFSTGNCLPMSFGAEYCRAWDAGAFCRIAAIASWAVARPPAPRLDLFRFVTFTVTDFARSPGQLLIFVSSVIRLSLTLALPPPCLAEYIAACSASAAPQPVWCEDSWCYVDPNNCTMPMSKSKYFPDSGLYYSYETCGFVDLYSKPQLDPTRNLRVTYMGDEYYKMYTELVTTADGSVRKVRRGLVPDFFNRMVEHLGLVNIVEVPLPDSSVEYVRSKFNTSSVFTACAALLASNGTDICVGDVRLLKPLFYPCRFHFLSPVAMNVS